jgi:hypothetical protein
MVRQDYTLKDWMLPWELPVGIYAQDTMQGAGHILGSFLWFADRVELANFLRYDLLGAYMFLDAVIDIYDSDDEESCLEALRAWEKSDLFVRTSEIVESLVNEGKNLEETKSLINSLFLDELRIQWFLWIGTWEDILSGRSAFAAQANRAFWEMEKGEPLLQAIPEELEGKAWDFLRGISNFWEPEDDEDA